MKPTKKQLKKIREIAKKYHLRMILLFGSQAEGKTHKESDIDVAFLPKKQLTFRQDYYLNYEFTNIFQNDKIDTVDIKKANPLLFYAIFKNPIILYKEDEMVFPTYRVYAFKKYVESKPLYEEKFRRLGKKIKKIKI